MKTCRTFDIDGVIFINKEIGGVLPRDGDFIITGRSFEEKEETERMLLSYGITNRVFYNQLPFDKKTRESSGIHKANTIKLIQNSGIKVLCHFEDDEIQSAAIKKEHPDLPIVMLVHDLTNKENVRHDF